MNTSDILNSVELLDAIKVITKLDKWNFMKKYEPHEGKGFINDNDETVKSIKYELANSYPGHSGSSLALTLRDIEYIAKNNFTIINYLRRRHFLLFIQNYEVYKNKLFQNEDIIKYIFKFL
jgi:hypothetical protein